jgi:hypothetical protein
VGTVVVNKKGAANKTVTVPGRSKPGRVRIRATGRSGNSATVRLKVTGRK